MALPIAVQVYSVRDDAAADLRTTLEKIKKMGYDGVEFAGLYGHAPAEIKAMCEEIGLTPISAHERKGLSKSPTQPITLVPVSDGSYGPPYLSSLMVAGG